MRDNPTSPEALIGRGTAYAFQRELESAIADFSKACPHPFRHYIWSNNAMIK